MKKIVLASAVLAAASGAFAADSLIAGFNFGQFIGSGYPSTDGTTGDAVGSIAANYSGANQPPSSASGLFRANNSIAGAYDPGYATWYWDGSQGSASFNINNGVDVVVFQGALPNSVNSATANGYNMVGADDAYAGLSFAVTNQKWSIVTSTLGYADSAAGLSFAAFGTGGNATIEWFFNGASVPFAISTILGGSDYSAYTVDLPAEFYGQASTSIQGRLTSGIVTFDNVQITGAVSAVPEPSSFAALAGLLGLGFAGCRRRRAA